MGAQWRAAYTAFMPDPAPSPEEKSARRAGWLMLAAAGAAAFLALIDPGTLSQTTAYAKDGRLRLEYSRLDRAAAPTRLRLWVAPGAADASGRLLVRLNAAYGKSMRLTKVSPLPEQVEDSGGDLVFVFRQRSPRDPSLVEFDLRPGELGRYAGRLAVASEQPIAFTQYMVP